MTHIEEATAKKAAWSRHHLTITCCEDHDGWPVEATGDACEECGYAVCDAHRTRRKHICDGRTF